jgi:hypothetical protein
MCWSFVCLRLVYGDVQHILCYVLCFVCLCLVHGGVQHILCYALCFVCLGLVYGGVQHILWDKQNIKHNTICVEHHHTQDEDK